MFRAFVEFFYFWFCFFCAFPLVVFCLLIWLLSVAVLDLVTDYRCLIFLSLSRVLGVGSFLTVG